MKRLILLVTAMPTLAAATRPPIAGIQGGGGVAVDPVACDWAVNTAGLEW
ncbi:MAG TPA: hypothetical protein VFI90_17865 [Rubrobacter sp.]|nr:hypothetical protein [Rubrobacter sp.]